MKETTGRRLDRRAGRRLLLVAAAFVLIVTVVGALLVGRAGDGDPASRGGTTMRLSVPGAGTAASCVGFSVDVLSRMPVAFAGTATRVRGGVVLLVVRRWYAGGSADRVQVRAVGGSTASLDDVVRFRDGRRYLVTASDGTVNSCGFSGPWSPRLASAFERAFRR